MTTPPANPSLSPRGEGCVRPEPAAWQALLAAALADGKSRLRFKVLDDDARGVLAGFEALGVGVHRDEHICRLEVQRLGGHWPAGEARLECVSPVGVWALAAACAVGVGRYEVACDSPDVPIAGLVDALRDLGAGIGYADREGRLPITLLARGLEGGTVRLSAEALPPWWPALLLVAPYARKDVFVDAPPEIGVRENSAGTLALMESFGVAVIADRKGRMIVPAPQRYRGLEM